MRTHPWRLRGLLLVLAATLVAAAILWPAANPWPAAAGTQRSAAGVAAAPPREAPAAASTAAVGAATQDGRLGRYGVVANPNADTVGAFLDVEVRDTAFAPESLGLVRAGALLETGATLEALGKGGIVHGVHVRSGARLDSALRAPAEQGCVLGVPVPLIGVPADSSWFLALPTGAAELVPFAGRQLPRDSVLDALAGVRLARLVPGDTQEVASGLARPAELFAALPFETHLRRFASEGIDGLIVDARRRRVATAHYQGQTTTLHLVEQRLLVAERAAGDAAAELRLAWSRYAVFDEDEVDLEEPLVVVRLGRERRLTLLTQGSYREGVGGLFVVRLTPGRWKTVAAWSAGC